MEKSYAVQLISNEDDAWIIVYRKADKKEAIRNIVINDFSEQFKVITYIGVIIIVWALILTVNKICKN